MKSSRSTKRLPTALVLLLIVVSLFSSCQRHFSPNFDLVSVHAMKGRIFADRQEDGTRAGGFSLLSSILKSLQRQNNPVIFMADNNSIHGTPAAYFSRGEHIIELLNSVGIDLMIADSREFYYGQERLAQLAKLADFPILSANVRDTQSGEVPPYLHSYYYDESINLLIIGLSSPSLISRNLSANVAGLELVSPGKAVSDALMDFQRDHGKIFNSGMAPSIQRPYVVVNAVSHKLANDAEAEILSELASVEGIDLLILGERNLAVDGMAPAPERPWYVLARNTPALPVWSDFDSWRGRLVLIDDERSDNASLIDRIRVVNSRLFRYQEYPLDSELIDPDDAISELLFSIREESETQLSSTVSSTSASMEHRFSGESPLGNLVTDAMLEYTGGDVALINSGAIRENLEEGSISLYDAYRILPFESGLITVEMSGADLLRLLNQSAMSFGDPAKEKGFLQFSGMRMEIVERDGVYLIDETGVQVAGEPLDMEKAYRIAITTYLHGGGDGYTIFADAPNQRAFTDSLLSVFISYLEGHDDSVREIGERIILNLD